MVDAGSSSLFQSLTVAETWYVVAICFGLGALGGLAHFLGDTGALPVVAPTPGASVVPEVVARWKWLREMLVGGVAAVAILFVVRRAEGVALVSSSLVAGYAGRAIMAALEDKAKATIAQQAAVILQQRANDATLDVHRLIDAFEKGKPTSILPVELLGTGPLEATVTEVKRKYQSRSLAVDGSAHASID